jgi:glycosyltransferase involved in cell wall biosynthesis
MPTLSVIIITKNEAHRIERCLESVAWADEIIVLDSGSTDGTADLCRHYSPKVKVWETDWPGYGVQKQRALEKATKDWVLSVDADEQVTPALGEELRTFLLEPLGPASYSGFYIKRCTKYGDRLLRFGAGFREYRLVLLRRDKGHVLPLAVHERIEVQGPIGRLKGFILHESFPNLHAVLIKMNDYSTLSAAQKKAKGQQGGVFKAITHGLFSFIKTYILKLGFLDGKPGFIMAVSTAEGSYYRYLKMMEGQ